jgi:hypothetical protein
MFSFVAIDRVIERERASNPAYRKRIAGRPLRSDARRLTDSELVERLRSLGIEMDPAILGGLCDKSLSAEAIVNSLVEQSVLTRMPRGLDEDWIWICLSALWQRWYPNKPSFEMLDDKMQSGYEMRDAGDAIGACRVWLAAWKDVLQIIDKTSIQTIDEFDELFKGTEPVFNWIQDLEDELWSAGFEDPSFLVERVAVCAEGLRRFEAENDLMTENRRRALAESYFEMGETGRAESLFREWLHSDPRWGWGWIGWSDCYRFTRAGDVDVTRAEELLRDGLAVFGVRHREDLVDRLVELCEEQGREEEAAEIEREFASIGETREVDLGSDLIRSKTTISFGGEGLPLDEFPNLVDAIRQLDSFPDEVGREFGGVNRKVGRNEPCPCGSGKKFKKCCG